MFRTIGSVPDVVNDLDLTDRLALSFIVPIGRRNLWLNPSFELSTLSLTNMGGGTMVRSTEKSRRGGWSIKYTPIVGVGQDIFYEDSTAGMFTQVTPGSTFVAGFDVWAKGGMPMRATLASATLGHSWTINWVGKDRWERRYIFGSNIGGANTYYSLNVYHAVSGWVTPFYLDGLQFELTTDGVLLPTTYLDGDQIGSVPGRTDYYWEGSPHNSLSQRIAASRSGGYEVALDELNFNLLGETGLGTPPVENSFLSRALRGGASYQGTKETDRSVTLALQTGGDFRTTLRAKNKLLDLVRRDTVKPDQAAVMRAYWREHGEPISDTFEIPCVYEGGLEGDFLNPYQARIPMNLRVPDNGLQLEGEGSSALAVTGVSTSGFFAKQDPNTGVWASIGTGTGGTGMVYGSFKARDGLVYIWGSFTSFNGVANTSRICFYDPVTGTVAAMGTGAANNIVYKVVEGADGTIYAVGTFTLMGGVANTDGVARWNGAAWLSLGTGVSAGTVAVYDAVIDPTTDNLYVTGEFTQMSGVANTVRVARWTGTTWLNLGTGLIGGAGTVTGRALAFVGVYLVVGGRFTTANGVVGVNNIALWNFSTFVALGSGLGTGGTSIVNKLFVTPDLTLLAVGDFTVSGAITLNYFGSWNGSVWTTLGGGLAFPAQEVFVSQVTGEIYAGGGGIFGSNGYIWTGSAWTYIPAFGSAPHFFWAMGMWADRTLWFSFNIVGVSAILSSTTAIVYDGKMETYPVYVLTGPTEPASGLNITLRNFTTQQVMHLRLYLLDGERMMLDLRPGRERLWSDQRGNLTAKIVPGSQPAQQILQPGTNIMEVMCYDSTGVATCTVTYKRRYRGLEGVID